jgi:hypothetical protein
VGASHHEGVVFRSLAPPVPSVEIGMAHRREDCSPVLLAFQDVVREVARRSRPRTIWASARARTRPQGEVRVFHAKGPRMR